MFESFEKEIRYEEGKVFVDNSVYTVNTFVNNLDTVFPELTKKTMGIYEGKQMTIIVKSGKIFVNGYIRGLAFENIIHKDVYNDFKTELEQFLSSYGSLSVSAGLKKEEIFFNSDELLEEIDITPILNKYPYFVNTDEAFSYAKKYSDNEELIKLSIKNSQNVIFNAKLYDILKLKGIPNLSEKIVDLMNYYFKEEKKTDINPESFAKTCAMHIWNKDILIDICNIVNPDIFKEIIFKFIPDMLNTEMATVEDINSQIMKNPTAFDSLDEEHISDLTDDTINKLLKENSQTLAKIGLEKAKKICDDMPLLINNFLVAKRDTTTIPMMNEILNDSSLNKMITEKTYNAYIQNIPLIKVNEIIQIASENGIDVSEAVINKINIIEFNQSEEAKNKKIIDEIISSLKSSYFFYTFDVIYELVNIEWSNRQPYYKVKAEKINKNKEGKDKKQKEEPKKEEKTEQDKEIIEKEENKQEEKKEIKETKETKEERKWKLGWSKDKEETKKKEKNEVKKPETKKPETKKPEVKKTEIEKTEIKKPEEIKKEEIKKEETKQPETLKEQKEEKFESLDDKLRKFDELQKAKETKNALFNSKPKKRNNQTENNKNKKYHHDNSIKTEANTRGTEASLINSTLSLMDTMEDFIPVTKTNREEKMKQLEVNGRPMMKVEQKKTSRNIWEEKAKPIVKSTDDNHKTQEKKKEKEVFTFTSETEEEKNQRLEEQRLKEQNQKLKEQKLREQKLKEEKLRELELKEQKLKEEKQEKLKKERQLYEQRKLEEKRRLEEKRKVEESKKTEEKNEAEKVQHEEKIKEPPKNMQLVILQKPDKLTYIKGQIFDPTGLVLVYKNLDTKELSSCSKFDVSFNDKEVIIKDRIYGLTTKLHVDIKENEEKELFVINKPDKTKYIEGQKIDIKGLIIGLRNSNGLCNYINDYKIINNTAKISDKGIIIKRNNLSLLIPLDIEERKIVEQKITKMPDKKTYVEGQIFDPKGLVITAKYNDGTEEDVKYSFPENLKVAMGKFPYFGNIEIPIEVIPRAIEKIYVSNLPEKLSYIEGQNFESKGMKISALYNDNTKEEITTYKCLEANNLDLDASPIIIKYNKFTTQVDIDIKPRKPVELKITKYPDKTQYIEGEMIIFEDMVLKETYNDGSTKIVKPYDCKFSTRIAELDTTEINVTKGDLSCNFKIEVSRKKLIRLSVTSESTFIETRRITKKDLTVTGYYDNKTEEKIKEYEIEDKEIVAGENAFKISVDKISTIFKFNGLKKEISSVNIINNPDKLEYIEGQKFNSEGLKIKIVYNNIIEEILDYKCEEKELILNETEFSFEVENRKLTIPITVIPRVIVKLEVAKLPDKLTYIETENFDTTGLTLQAVYNDESRETIDNSLITYEPKISKQVKLSYAGFDVYIDTEVLSKQITGIEIKQGEYKEIKEEVKIDKEKIKVFSIFNDGSKEETKKYKIVPEITKKEQREYKIVVGNIEEKIEFDVIPKKLEKIEIKSEPKKRQYLEGEYLDLKGLVIYGIYDNDTKEKVEGYEINIEKTHQLRTTDEKVIISYEGLSLEIAIRVDPNPDYVKEKTNDNYVESKEIKIENKKSLDDLLDDFF